MPLKIIVIDGLDYELSTEELEDRIRAVLTPVEEPLPPEPAKSVCYRGLVLDLESRRAFHKMREIPLTPIEFDLLEYLLHNRGRYISAAELEDNVWNRRSSGWSNAVAIRIHHLRRKLRACGLRIGITTRRGLGYILL
jgi:DNA-binding response OmpR family regulator